jgi:hypothetical protein
VERRRERERKPNCTNASASLLEKPNFQVGGRGGNIVIFQYNSQRKHMLSNGNVRSLQDKKK